MAATPMPMATMAMLPMATTAMPPMVTTAMLDIPMPDFMVMLTMECHSDPAPVLTPSPRDLTPPPRDLCTIRRSGLLMLMPTMAMPAIPMPTGTMPTMECHSGPAPVLTPSPRALTPPPRDTCHTTDTDTTDTDTTTASK